VAGALSLSPDELLSTTRTVRRRLDFDRPVAREAVVECLSLAVQAPNACNAQTLRFLVVEDPELRHALAQIYRKGYEIYRGQEFRAGNILTGDPQWDGAQHRIEASADYLAENIHRAPVLVVPVLEGLAADPQPRIYDATVYGSAMPAVWSFCLAARSRGLGTAWTTVHLIFEQEAAALLGIAYETSQQLALIPVAHTLGTGFKPAYRLPVERAASFYPQHPR
jgi:nitroreductase